jgi:RimJ/RimL family protein N-acetyltransferase
VTDACLPSPDSPDSVWFLRGNKVALRAFRTADLSSFQHWLNDERVTHFLEMGARPTRDSDLASFWKLADETDSNVVFAMCDANDGAIVGTCGLYSIDWIVRRAQFNILIGEPRAWNRGLGTEATELILEYAFSKLNLAVVHLGVNADNERAIRAYEKAGFVREGLRRRFIYRNGRYYDLVYMGILREEFSQRSAAC